MNYQTSISDLPPEMVEKIIQKFTSIQDVINCSLALVGTRQEKFVTQKFLKPQLNYLKSQLKIFASLDLNLKESLRNEGWSKECEDIKLIIDLWKEFKPSLPGKYLVASRKGHEIVDLLNPNTKYQLLANNVPRVDFATGGLLQKSPIVCGGRDEQWNVSQDCVVIGQPEIEMKMIEKRQRAASVALDQSTLWIVGGYNGRNDLRSTEFIKLGQPSVKGPDLPFRIYGHSMTQYDEKSIYIIGGYQNRSISKKTWIVDLTNGFKITEGPSLNNGRAGHGCAKMSLNGRTILVVAGGYNSGFLDSVEILDPLGNNVWTQGPNLPLGLARHTMVTSPTGKGVIVMGGTYSKAMFELSQSMEWTRLEHTLQIGHYVPLAIPIPDELVSKQD